METTWKYIVKVLLSYKKCTKIVVHFLAQLKMKKCQAVMHVLEPFLLWIKGETVDEVSTTIVQKLKWESAQWTTMCNHGWKRKSRMTTTKTTLTKDETLKKKTTDLICYNVQESTKVVITIDSALEVHSTSISLLLQINNSLYAIWRSSQAFCLENNIIYTN